MGYTLIDGLKVAGLVRENIGQEVAKLKDEYQRVPGIAVILVGDDPASNIYVSSKERAALKAGMKSTVVRLAGNVPEQELIDVISGFNEDPQINGILVQLPLPGHINQFNIINAISPEKDVDGFHPVNIGNLSLGLDTFIPCTPYGVMKLLEAYNIDPSGKHAVIAGRSNIVGKPMGMLLLGANATVTVCHSKTPDLAGICRQADILVAAVGRPEMINGNYIKEGAVIIDVGINRVDGRLCGDVDFKSATLLCSAITPVPKGVGPMTITMLMQNTLHAFKKTL